jgi:hypothetical protein
VALSPHQHAIIQTCPAPVPTAAKSLIRLDLGRAPLRLDVLSVRTDPQASPKHRGIS